MIVETSLQDTVKIKNNIDNETFKYDKIMECHVTGKHDT